MRPTHLDLFSGIGSCSLASHWAGFETVAYCEIEPYCQAVLRKNFGKDIEIHGDITTFDAVRFRGIDLVTGGFPCQDISAAGKGAGLHGERSSLWFEMLRVVRECQPLFVLVENSPMLRTRGSDRLLGDLEEAGYTAGATVVGAGNAGAPHLRQRCFVVAYSCCIGGKSDYFQSIGSYVERHSSETQREWHSKFSEAERRVKNPWNHQGEPTARPTIPGVNARSTRGLDPYRKHRVKALGNTNPPSVYYAFLKPIADELRRLHVA